MFTHPRNHMAQLLQDRQGIRPCSRIGPIDTSTGIEPSSNRHRDLFMSVAIANLVCSVCSFSTFSDLAGPRPAAPEMPHPLVALPFVNRYTRPRWDSSPATDIWQFKIQHQGRPKQWKRLSLSLLCNVLLCKYIQYREMQANDGYHRF